MLWDCMEIDFLYRFTSSFLFIVHLVLLVEPVILPLGYVATFN